jgi:hypothetical protein
MEDLMNLKESSIKSIGSIYKLKAPDGKISGWRAGSTIKWWWCDPKVAKISCAYLGAETAVPKLSTPCILYL